jgi:hypothetical protein
LATIFYALSSACFGFAFNALVSMELSKGLEPSVMADWTAYRNIGLIIGSVLLLLAVLLTLDIYNRIEQLKSQTTHGTAAYVPRSAFKWAMLGLAIVAVLAVGIFIGRVL